MRRLILALLCCAALAASAGAARGADVPPHIFICSGFGCAYKTRFVITDAFVHGLKDIMRGADRSAEAERAAIGRAVQHFERAVTEVIGVADRPQAAFADRGKLGQMDCIDETTNTTNLLEILAGLDLLRHHSVEAPASRGFFLDLRYPHMTAVVGEHGGGRWVVDSWYEAAGGPPDIMPLEAWRRRGGMRGR